MRAKPPKNAIFDPFSGVDQSQFRDIIILAKRGVREGLLKCYSPL
jgi:hypothetical protein